MQKEMESLEKNDVWELTELPKGRQPDGSKWVFKMPMERLSTTRHDSKSLQYVQVYAVKNRIDFSTLSDVCTKENICDHF